MCNESTELLKSITKQTFSSITCKIYEVSVDNKVAQKCLKVGSAGLHCEKWTWSAKCCCVVLFLLLITYAVSFSVQYCDGLSLLPFAVAFWYTARLWVKRELAKGCSRIRGSSWEKKRESPSVITVLPLCQSDHSWTFGIQRKKERVNRGGCHQTCGHREGRDTCITALMSALGLKRWLFLNQGNWLVHHCRFCARKLD